MAEGEAKGKVTKETIKRVSKVRPRKGAGSLSPGCYSHAPPVPSTAISPQGVYDINLKEYSRLTGYAWGGKRARELAPHGWRTSPRTRLTCRTRVSICLRHTPTQHSWARLDSPTS